MKAFRIIIPAIILIALVVFVANKAQATPVVNMVGKLPVHPWERYGTRSMEQVTNIVMHHTAGDLTLNQIADIHIHERGWAGIAYHFIIDKDGTVYQTNSVTTESTHARGANPESIGVCLIGNFDNEKPTRAQYQAARKLVTSLRLEYRQIRRVTHHRDHTNTSCPGQYFDISQVAPSNMIV